MSNFIFYIQRSFQDEKMIPSGWMCVTANGTSTVTSDVELIKKNIPQQRVEGLYYLIAK